MAQNKAIEMIREQLADYAHEAWSGWMKYLFSKCNFYPDESATIPIWAVKCWKLQASTDYKDLPEDMKPSDRKEADRMLAITQLAAVTSERDEAVELLKDAVKLIEQWHNMDEYKLPKEEKGKAWEIYYNHAPEMKDIHEFLDNRKEASDAERQD